MLMLDLRTKNLSPCLAMSCAWLRKSSWRPKNASERVLSKVHVNFPQVQTISLKPYAEQLAATATYQLQASGLCALQDLSSKQAVSGTMVIKFTSDRHALPLPLLQVAVMA